MKNKYLTLEQIASVCHETIRSYCEAIGDPTFPSWVWVSTAQKKSSIEAVRFTLENRSAGPEAQHNQWKQSKLDDGWVYGHVKDDVNKTHPCITEYTNLPLAQKVKDTLFIRVVESLRPMFENELNDEYLQIEQGRRIELQGCIERLQKEFESANEEVEICTK